MDKYLFWSYVAPALWESTWLGKNLKSFPGFKWGVRRLEECFWFFECRCAGGHGWERQLTGIFVCLGPRLWPWLPLLFVRCETKSLNQSFKLPSPFLPLKQLHFSGWVSNMVIMTAVLHRRSVVSGLQEPISSALTQRVCIWYIILRASL